MQLQRVEAEAVAADEAAQHLYRGRGEELRAKGWRQSKTCCQSAKKTDLHAPEMNAAAAAGQDWLGHHTATRRPKCN